jgi:hypothetical protein
MRSLSARSQENAATVGLVRVLLCCAVVTLAAAVGCVNRTDAQKLSDSGLSLANSLANYYDTLGKQVDDLVEMEAFNDVLRGIPTTDFRTYEDRMEQSKEALERRARLARQLAATYQSLRDLSSYDASGEVSNSFDQLGKSLAGIPPLQSLSASSAAGPPADPGQLLSKGAGLLASWKQSRDIGKAVESVTETLSGLDTLFGRELPAYQSISAEKVEKTSALAGALIKKKQVIVWPLLEQDIESIGLKLAHPDQPPSDPALTGGLAAVVQARAERLQSLADSAGQSLLDGLNRQLASQRQFQAKQGISVSDIQVAVEQANAYLDEIAAQKQSAKH